MKEKIINILLLTIIILLGIVYLVYQKIQTYIFNLAFNIKDIIAHYSIIEISISLILIIMITLFVLILLLNMFTCDECKDNYFLPKSTALKKTAFCSKECENNFNLLEEEEEE